MNHSTYTKHIPPFIQTLLNKISKINIFSFDESNGYVNPSEVVHYQPFKTGINIFTSQIIKLSHELSHMCETKDNQRLLKCDYGIGEYFPKTHKGQLQAVAREARTRGIQTRLVEIAFGNSTLLVHRGAHLYIKPFQNRVGRFETSKEVLEWSAGITQTAYCEWSKDKIIHEWNKKSEFINHWLETSGVTQSEYKTALQRYNTNG